ncbi:Techylectin-5A [Bulinus truncatus]|nr:Techylectin-5A [Bulinus truncatus]
MGSNFLPLNALIAVLAVSLPESCCGIVSSRISQHNCPYHQYHCRRGMTSVTFYKKILPRRYGEAKYLCDTKTDGGGWIVIIRRVNRDTLFNNRTWSQYKQGFGHVCSDYYIGNNFISNITNLGKYEMRVDMVYQSRHYFAYYRDFSISNEESNYTLHLDGYTGDAGDDLKYVNHIMFSTPDRDNDLQPEGSCSKEYNTGWWFKDCHAGLLTGDFTRGRRFGEGVVWPSLTGYYRNLGMVEMKIRRQKPPIKTENKHNKSDVSYIWLLCDIPQRAIISAQYVYTVRKKSMGRNFLPLNVLLAVLTVSLPEPCCGIVSSNVSKSKCPNHQFDCKRGIRSSTSYITIYPKRYGDQKYLCDTKTDGGGWIVIIRRINRDTLFNNKTWSQYKQGFGHVCSDYYIGNNFIYNMTNSGKYEMRVDMVYQSRHYFAHYTDFNISNEESNYTLHVDGYTGDAGNDLEYVNHMMFSTLDRDNDLLPQGSCSKTYNTAWWFKACHAGLLTGDFTRGNRFGEGVIWPNLTGFYSNVDMIEMKIRRQKPPIKT